MRAGQASATAQRVAALRLTFDRVMAEGDPAADERLARDVAGSVERQPGGLLDDYLRARTSFFDRVVVGALDAGLRQVVVAAAGYDGRALRYARPGVRWFEVDHPDTQGDKVERLRRLDIDTAQITFVAADFTVDRISDLVDRAGFDRGAPALFLCEGIAVYLEREVLESLLSELRRLAAPASRLAISLSVSADSTSSERRERFQGAVAALGEPTRSLLTAEDAETLFSTTGWTLPALDPAADERRERANRAGFVLVQPA